MTTRRNSTAFWAGIAVFLVAVAAMTQIVRNEYPFFAGYVILQFIVLSVAWSILGGYAGYVNFGTNAFFGVGVYTSVALFKASGAPLVVQIAAAAVVGMLLGLAVGLLTLRMRGIFFSIATIALAIIIETLVINWRFVGGAAGIQLQRPPVTAPFDTYVKLLFMVQAVLVVIAIATARGIWPSREAMFEAYRGRGAFRTWPEAIVRDYIDGGSVDYLDDRQVRLACTPGWEAANYRAGPPDGWRGLEKLRCPITVIVGDKRSTCPEPVIELLLERRPDIRIVHVEGASHFLPMEFPDVVRREIRAMAGFPV